MVFGEFCSLLARIAADIRNPGWFQDLAGSHPRRIGYLEPVRPWIFILLVIKLKILCEKSRLWRDCSGSTDGLREREREMVRRDWEKQHWERSGLAPRSGSSPRCPRHDDVVGTPSLPHPFKKKKSEKRERETNFNPFPFNFFDPYEKNTWSRTVGSSTSFIWSFIINNIRYRKRVIPYDPVTPECWCWGDELTRTVLWKTSPERRNSSHISTEEMRSITCVIHNTRCKQNWEFNVTCQIRIRKLMLRIGGSRYWEFGHHDLLPYPSSPPRTGPVSVFPSTQWTGDTTDAGRWYPPQRSSPSHILEV